MRTTILTVLLATALADACAKLSRVRQVGREQQLRKRPDRPHRQQSRDRLQRKSAESNGGLPEYRNKSVQSVGQSDYRVIDEFSNAQVSAGHTEYTLRKVDSDRIVMDQSGTTLNLQRCK